MEEEDCSDALAYLVNSIQALGEQLSSSNEHIRKIPELIEQFKSFRDEIKDIRESVSAYRGELYQAVGKQVELEYEIGELRKPQQTNANDHELEVKLDHYIKDIYENLEYHQYYIEQVDNQTRNKNLIFHGVTENSSSELGADDKEKIRNIINKTGNSEIGEFTITRLGQNQEHQDNPRPILVKVDSHVKQKMLLTKAKRLKDEIGYSNIYIKKIFITQYAMN